MSQFESQFEERLYNERQEKLAKIAEIARAADPTLLDAAARYPNSFRFTHTIPELRLLGDPLSTDDLAANKIEAAIAGRIMAIRVQGKAGFAQLQQGGQRLQLYVRKDDVGEDQFALYKLLDLGDHIGVRGYLMRTRTGELTLHVQSITFLTKAMLALPDKYHGLEDVETRYRQRYVDLIMNSGTRAEVASVPSPQPATTPSPAPGTISGAPSSATASSSPKVGSQDAIPGTTPTTDTAPANAQHEDAPQNVREVFVKRAAILRAIRRFFDARNYLEVETPMLHTVAGGAAARPFTTHHNALDIPLSLRIAPELYLKRLVVGGMDRVYEINRNFRNEGVSTRHNPEFTMLEFYQAYANYHDLMDLTEELIKFVATEVNGTTITHFNGNEIDLGRWTKLSMREAIIKFWPREVGPVPEMSAIDGHLRFQHCLQSAIRYCESTLETFSDGDALDEAKSIADDPVALESYHELMEHKARVQNIWRTLCRTFDEFVKGGSGGKAIAETFELFAEPHLIQPTIIYGFPLAVSPLSKVKPDEPDWVERFEFYIGGFEVGNAFSELNDADDQRRRFAAQVDDKDPESMAEVDEDYVRALGYGLPPTAGEGVGIDRLTMLLTGSRSIRDVILFPLMRPLAKSSATEEPHGESAE